MGDRCGLLLPDVEEEIGSGLDGEGWEAIGGKPLVGGLLGLVVLFGFEAEGDGADDGDAKGAGFAVVEFGEGEEFGLGGLGVEILRLLGVLLAEGGFCELGVFFAEFVVF
jgi:hypothetical protein